MMAVPKTIRFDTLDVMIAEDSDQMRAYLRSIFETAGTARIRDARDGTEALAAIRAEPPDLMVTDFQMPGLDGPALTLAIRSSASERLRFMPIVMVTAFTERSQLRKAFDAGVNSILHKPVLPADLLQAVAAALATPRPFVRARGYFGPDRRSRQVPVIGDRRAPTVESE